MALSSPRADSLSIICDLVLLISQKKIIDTRSLRQLLTVPQSKDGFPKWGRTRQYHYTSALRDFKLVEMLRHKIELTSQARVLARVVDFGNLIRRRLNEGEKTFLRNHLLSYDPLRAFLTKFLLTSKQFEGYEQLITDGGIIIFEKDKVTGTERLIKANGEPELLPKACIYEVKWTLKNWCKELELIDEIFLEHSMDNVGDRHRRVFFPLKIRVDDLTVNDFRSRIDSLIRTRQYAGKFIRISMLMYDFCTTYFLSVKGFQYLLGELYRELPNKYRLEKISSVYIDERPHRVNGYTNYPKIDDCYRYSLVVK